MCWWRPFNFVLNILKQLKCHLIRFHSVRILLLDLLVNFYKFSDFALHGTLIRAIDTYKFKFFFSIDSSFFKITTWLRLIFPISTTARCVFCFLHIRPYPLFMSQFWVFLYGHTLSIYGLSLIEQSYKTVTLMLWMILIEVLLNIVWVELSLIQDPYEELFLVQTRQPLNIYVHKYGSINKTEHCYGMIPYLEIF